MTVDSQKTVSLDTTETALKSLVVTIISLETIVRFFVAPVKSVFFLSAYGVVDILAILPFW